MQVSQCGSRSVWTQISQDALFERIRHVLVPNWKQLRAVDDRLSRVRSDPSSGRVLMELEGAKQRIGFPRNASGKASKTLDDMEALAGVVISTSGPRLPAVPATSASLRRTITGALLRGRTGNT